VSGTLTLTRRSGGQCSSVTFSIASVSAVRCTWRPCGGGGGRGRCAGRQEFREAPAGGREAPAAAGRGAHQRLVRGPWLAAGPRHLHLEDCRRPSGAPQPPDLRLHILAGKGERLALLSRQRQQHAGGLALLQAAGGVGQSAEAAQGRRPAEAAPNAGQAGRLARLA
jgi:hypothetical protein